MRAVIQRVKSASVSVNEEPVGSIGPGLLLLVGFGAEDTETCLLPMAKKIANMRIFSDGKGRFQHSLLDVAGGVLVVPQFTLYADTSKGRRPEFSKALAPAAAKALWEKLCEEFLSLEVKTVARGVFGAHMEVNLVNDGPVTITLEDE